MNSKSPTSEQEFLLLHPFPSFHVMHEDTRQLPLLLYNKSFEIICLVFPLLQFIPPPTYQPQRCFFRCTLKYTDADIIRTDSVQHVEPIAFEHLNVRRQILATVDPCKMKWVLTVRTGNRHLWEIEQLQLWNSLRIESSTVVGWGWTTWLPIAQKKHRGADICSIVPLTGRHIMFGQSCHNSVMTVGVRSDINL